MKKIFFLLIAFFIFINNTGFAQRTEPGEFNGKIIYTGSSSSGTISVTVDGFAKNKIKSISDAKAGAFYTLLFRGIPGSAYELPMVPDENEKRNNASVKELLNGGYAAFIMEDNLVSEKTMKRKTDGMKGVETEIALTINCDALRRYLEKNNVIRKFGI